MGTKHIYLYIIVMVLSNFSYGLMTADSFSDGCDVVKLEVFGENGLNTYRLSTTAKLRDNQPSDKTRTFSESADFPYLRSGNVMFDSLYALALDDAKLNAVDKIRDGSFDVREAMNRSYFQTGQKWNYVWTRDVSYSIDLALASLDKSRCRNSLLFKTTRLKTAIDGKYSRQIVQDTGSGGSYPVSTDRVVWALGAWQLLKYLSGSERVVFLEDSWQIMRDTIEHDRQVIFDPDDQLYRGEQSFLDWREQTYPGWTKDNVLAIAKSKALSTNIGHYQLLKIAARLAGEKGLTEYQNRYNKWAEILKSAINKEFYIDSKGLYSSLILDEPVKIRLNRFDLLGQSLAIICGVADKTKAEKIISNYPQAKYGPPVVWPQEKTVPIYHNHALWPFVTAYWLSAAKETDNAAAVEAAVYSLVRAAALNLSNMENLDFVTGQAFAKVNGISGPEINSQRQLWSVAGYLSMVQDVIYGLKTDYNGIRFLPFITAAMHRDYFKDSKFIELKNFKYRGKIINVKVNLPTLTQNNTGSYNIDKIYLNDKQIKKNFVDFSDLQEDNHWQIWLCDSDKTAGDIRMVEDLSLRNIFGPKQPRWKSIGHGGITVESGKLKLHYSNSGEKDVLFNIYRNGRLCAQGISKTEWLDNNSANYKNEAYFYMIESYYPDSGNCSHLTEARFYSLPGGVVKLGAATMKNEGGNLVGNHHFENWGRQNHQLSIDSFMVKTSGTYLVNATYSNGAGPINTGMTCSVKKIEIADDSNSVIASSYFVMPHTANWQRYLDSSSFRVDLQKAKRYSIKIFEDCYARNMSYFDHYESYKGTGNGTNPYNYVNISQIKLTCIKNICDK